MTATELDGFVYAEHLEGTQQRSLGFRLLVPESRPEWSVEVESLARRLQAAPYPDHWPIAELFCSVLLSTGERLIALARYGLEDHTPSHRRGGLELLGVIGPPSINVTASLAIYHWLRQRRSATAISEVRSLGGKFELMTLLAEAPTPPVLAESVPVMPVRLWQDGALLFAATQATDPDQRLGMLEQTVSDRWQWLPLIGNDFPISQFAQRGPLIAWTPHLSGVAVKVDHAANPLSHSAIPRARGIVTLVLVGLGVILLGANLWATLRLTEWMSRSPRVPEPITKLEPDERTEPKPNRESEADLETVARQLHLYFLDQGVFREHREGQLVQQYEKLNRKNDFFRVKSTEAKLALGAMVELTSRRSPAQIEALIRSSSQGKGLDEEVVNLIAQRVYQKLVENQP